MPSRTTLLVVALLAATAHAAGDRNANRIKPWKSNPRYWQYKGKPVLLLGGSRDDNLFQIPNLKAHLDDIRRAGGNYIRNTMSDRPDHKFEVYPYHRQKDGKYDLSKWNDVYWKRFENLLRWTAERDIIVQIEVWDRFDYTDAKKVKYWQPNPWRPANNINYTARQTGLAATYRDHPARDKHPFFHTIPGMSQYQRRYDRIRHFQERFVEKMLSYSLPRGNVLYCMNNETSTDPKWGQYWMAFIRKRARAAGVEIYATDMFDDVYKAEKSKKLRLQFDSPKMYPFIDISQVNSRNFNEKHWNKLIWIVRQVKKSPRPLNHTKIYSAGQTSFGSGTPVDGVERFWRNLIAGSASCRFHRPTSGIGLNKIAQACIAAARKAESEVPFWDVNPNMKLLRNREKDEAYLAANTGTGYLLYFTNGGSVDLDLRAAKGSLSLRWIDITTGRWGNTGKLTGGGWRPIKAPGKGGWVAAIKVARR